MSQSVPGEYLPTSAPSAPACAPGDFPFAAVALDHGHIYGQCEGLTQAGGTLRGVYDPDPEKVAAFQSRHPGIPVARSLEEILDDPAIRLVAAAAVPSKRGALGERVLAAGKDYFTDKTPFTSLAQLDSAHAAVHATGRRWFVYYSERLHSECAVHAGTLIARGAIGRVVQTIGTGPHRLSAGARPAWFFERASYGGILCDIGSHQSEQFLHYTDANDATVTASAVGNFANPAHPELEDFGEASLVADNGASGYYRVDWLTPDGLRTWGDGRTIILGTEGTIELRKFIDVARPEFVESLLILVNARGEFAIPCAGRVGYPFFGALIRDCLDGTETAMTQAHIFKAAELGLRAQAAARHLT